MLVDVRLMGQRGDVDAAERALRAALVIPGEQGDGRDYPNRRGAGIRRYLTATGVAPAAAGAAATVPAGDADAAEPDAADSRSPRERVRLAEAARDLFGQVDALVDGVAELMRQSWYPLVEGDVVLWAAAAYGLPPGPGTTYVALAERDAAGCALLRPVSSTGEGDDEDQDDDQALTEQDWYGVPAAAIELVELWMESERDEITVIRGGRVVHGPRR